MASLLRRAAAVLCAVALSALGLSGCAVRKSPYGQGFRVPLGADPLHLDPQVASDTASLTVLRSLMTGLTVYENGEILPSIADRWELSEDGTVYTFFLKEARWHDGSPLTAEDFVFAWRRAVDPSTRSPHAARFLSVRGAEEICSGASSADTLGVTAVDAQTLRVELKTADEDFLKYTASTAFFPCNTAFFEATGGRYGLGAEYTASCGAFKLLSWERGEYLILEKNELYVFASDVLPSRVRYIATAYEDAVGALESGALDIAPLTEAQAESLGEDLSVHTVSDSLYALWFNTELPALQDAAVRRALRAGLEIEVLRSDMTAQGLKLADGFLPPDAVIGNEIYRTGQNSCSFESGNAAALLREALGDSSMPTLTVLCADDTDSIRHAQYVVQSWQKNLNLYFSLTPLPAENLKARMQVGNYQIALYTQIGVNPEASSLLAAFSVSAEQGNPSRVSDAALTEMLLSADGQRKALEAAEQYLSELCPCVPLAFPLRYFGCSEGVAGLRAQAFSDGTYFPAYNLISATRDA